MRSKLEIHSERIAKRLAEGATYAAIAEELNAAGVQTTRQNIQTWVARRAKKLEKRAALAKSLTSTL